MIYKIEFKYSCIEIEIRPKLIKKDQHLILKIENIFGFQKLKSDLRKDLIPTFTYTSGKKHPFSLISF